MKKRKILALIFIIIAVVFGVKFYLEIEFPVGLEAYLKKEYYGQFGPMAISIELLIAGIYLFVKHSKANFTLALFGFTAILDPIFNLIGLFSTTISLYATVVFVCCAILSLWIAFTDTFKMGRISIIGALVSFILGNVIELFFNLN